MKFSKGVIFIFLTILLTACGDSYNSRVFQGDKSLTGDIQSCKGGCYGFPAEWYDLGLIVDKDGNVVLAPDPTVKKAGSCYFKVCSDPDSSYTKDAQEWVARFGGDIIFDDSDVIKCDALKSSTMTISSSVESTVDFEKEPEC